MKTDTKIILLIIAMALMVGMLAGYMAAQQVLTGYYEPLLENCVIL